MNNKILIRNITNLTDARYFAAMNVDWISMRLTEDPSTFARWHTLRDWISGLKLAAEIHTTDESLIAKTIIDASPDGIISDDVGIIHLTGGIDLFITTEHVISSSRENLYIQILPLEVYRRMENVSQPLKDQLFLESDWSPEMISEVMQSGFNGGFSFPLVNQTDNGMKDYTAMDQMIEVIQIESGNS